MKMLCHEAVGWVSMAQAAQRLPVAVNSLGSASDIINLT
jgi:hypothetical protein